jgi:hypothetical protein
VLLKVKYGQSLVGERGKKKIYVKGKRSLPSKKLIFRNGQPVRDDDHRIFAAMTST